MRVIIDGYNLAHASTWLGLKGRVREPKGLRLMMIQMLAHYAPLTDDRITVIFDGLPADRQRTIDIGARAGMEVLFSGYDVNADTQIEKMLEISTGARDTLVVSSDRAVRAAASRHGAPSCRAGEYFNRIRAALTRREAAAAPDLDAKYAGLDDADVRLWMRILGFDDESDSAPDT